MNGKNTNWESEVSRIILDAKSIRQNGKTASYRTIELTRDVMCHSIRILRKLGFKITNPANIGQRHLMVLVKYWYEEQHKKPKTMVNDLSRIRQFMRVAGKPGLVKNIREYLPDVDPNELVVPTTLKKSKSWSAAGINMTKALEKADAYDKVFGLLLRMELGLGLRRIEAIKCNPHKQDRGSFFEIPPGHAKGGRPRLITIDTPAKREMLDFVKSRCDKNSHLGWKVDGKGNPVTLKQNITRYNNCMKRVGFTKRDSGVTGHGLRAQYAENSHVEKGILPATLAGQKNQMGRDELRKSRAQVSQELGHNRIQITASYGGTLKVKPSVSPETLVILNIRQSLELITPGAVPQERRSDCHTIADELSDFGLDLTMHQIHALWKIWSQRYGLEWTSPVPGMIVKSIEAAATTLRLQSGR